MLLGGLWHGANLRFIVWGALHGLALSLHKSFKELFPKRDPDKKSFFGSLFTPLFVLITFHFVAFCWIFFRAKDFDIALNIINNIQNITYNPQQWQVIFQGYQSVFILIIFGYIWHFFPQSMNDSLKNLYDSMPIIFKAAVIALVFWVVYATASSEAQPFIYFQF